MIDAGESEQNIGAVIQHFKSITPVSSNEPGTFAGGFINSLKQQFADAAGPAPTAGEMPFAHVASPETQEFMNTPLVRPTGTRLDALASPAALAMMGVGAGARLANTEPPVSYQPTPIRSAIRMAGQGMESTPGAGVTARFVGRLMQKVPVPQTFQDQPLYKQMEQLPSTDAAPPERPSIVVKPAAGKMEAQYQSGPQPLNPPMPMRGRLSMPPYQASGQTLSSADVAQLRAQGYSPEMIAKIMQLATGK